jgi:hypothetical protein
VIVRTDPSRSVSTSGMWASVLLGSVLLGLERVVSRETLVEAATTPDHPAAHDPPILRYPVRASTHALISDGVCAQTTPPAISAPRPTSAAEKSIRIMTFPP